MPSDLDIVVPVYNEAENFGAFVDSLLAHVRTPHRVLVVYDREDDTTLPVARAAMARHPGIVLVRNPVRGVLSALKTGLAAVEAPAAIISMADLSDDHAKIDRMVELFREGADLVAASRYSPGGEQIGGPFVKGLMSRTAGLSLHYLGGVGTKDATNNFKLYSKRLIDAVTIESQKGFEVALELTVKAHRLGMKIVEVPATWRDRTAGQSNFKIVEWLPGYLHWYWFGLSSRWERT